MKKFIYKKENLFKGLLVFISFLFYVAYLVKFIKFANSDNTPLHWDYATHINNTLDYLKIIKKASLKQLLEQYSFYPPFLYIFLSIFILLLGLSKTTIVIFNFTLLAFFVILIFLILRKIANFLVALNTVFLCLISIIIFTPQGIRLYEFMLDFPTTIMIIVNYLFLLLIIKTKNRSPYKFFLLGLLTSFSLLAKWTSVIYLIFSQAIILIFYLKYKNITKVLISYLLPIIFISGPWYIYHLKPLLFDLNFFSVKQGFIDNDPQLFAGFSYYLITLLNSLDLLNIIIFIVIVKTIINIYNYGFKIIKKVSLENIYSVLFLLIPFIFFSLLISNKDPRYLYPFFLSITLISFIYIVQKINFRYHLTIMFILIFLFGFALISNYKFPKIKLDKTAYTYTEKMLLKSNYDLVGYFFEDDAAGFHYANIDFLHRKLAMNNQYIPYIYLNRMNTLDKNIIYGCQYNNLPSAIFVYNHKLYKNQQGKNHAEFINSCPKELIDKYNLIKQFQFDEESLKVYYLKI